MTNDFRLKTFFNDFFSKHPISKKTPIYLAVFLFPILVATVNHGGSTIYALLLLFGLFLGWPAWQSLESWEKKVLLGFAIFFILISLSFLNNQDFYNGFKKEMRYLLFPLFVPMYLLFKKYQVETGKVYLFGLFIASFVMFGQMLYELYTYPNNVIWFRATGAYNYLIFGDVAMLVVAIMVCALLTVSKNRWHFLLGFLAIGLALSVSVMSGARGGWILLPVVAVWLLLIKQESLGTIRLTSIVIIICLLFWGGVSLNQIKYKIDLAIKDYQNYSQGSEKMNSVGARLDMWHDSIIIWKEHPIVGTGIGDFYLDETQLIEDGRSNLKRAFGHAHNSYFNALAITGMVGLFAVLVLINIIPYLMFYSFWKKEHDPWIQFYALSGMTTIIAFAVFGLTLDWFARNPFVRTYLMSILVFMSSIAVIKSREKKLGVVSHKS